MTIEKQYYPFNPVEIDFKEDGQISFVNLGVAQEFIKMAEDEFGGKLIEGEHYELYDLAEIYHDAESAYTDWLASVPEVE